VDVIFDTTRRETPARRWRDVVIVFALNPEHFESSTGMRSTKVSFAIYS
jgi:hypothetical protein